MKDTVAEILGLSNISLEDLLNELRGPNIIKLYRKLSTEENHTVGYCLLLKVYVHSSFRDFESYLRIVVGLDENDIQLKLKQYNSKFTTSKISPGAYTFKDFLNFCQQVFLKIRLKS